MTDLSVLPDERIYVGIWRVEYQYYKRLVICIDIM